MSDGTLCGLAARKTIWVRCLACLHLSSGTGLTLFVCPAYNRVGLTEYFQHRNVSDLYLNSPSWYASQLPDRFAFSTGEKVIEIDPDNKNVFTSEGNVYQYDILVLATGSNGALPPYISPAQAAETKGIFVYRNVSDLEAILDYADKPEITRASVVGGGVRRPPPVSLGLPLISSSCSSSASKRQRQSTICPPSPMSTFSSAKTTPSTGNSTRVPERWCCTRSRSWASRC